MFRRQLKRAKGYSGLTNVLLATGALVSAGCIAWTVMSQLGQRRKQHHVEKFRDKALKDSFPASDPPASQYFDIPVNRV